MEKQANYREIYKIANDVTGNNSKMITGYKAQSQEIVIPGQINAYNVTKISDDAFEGCELLTSVKIENGVREIGNRVFAECTSIKTLLLPNTVKVIGKQAFKNCTSLTELVLPEHLLELEDELLCNCKNLKEITVPRNVRRMGFGVFSGCERLEVITLPARFIVTPWTRAYYGIASHVKVLYSAEPLDYALKEKINNATVGETILFGQYAMGLEGEIDAIAWIVLANENSRKLILANQLLEYMPYGNTKKWHNSAIRTWLNYEFFNTAFCDTEKNAVIYSSLSNPKMSGIKISGAKTDIESEVVTKDMIFLMSIEEVEKYLSDPALRSAKESAYVEKNSKKKGKQTWMLRSDVKGQRYTVSINGNGKYVTNTTPYNSALVRPALWISGNDLPVNMETVLNDISIDTMVQLLTCSTASINEAESCLVEYLKKYSKKIIAKLIDETSIAGLIKMLSLPNIVTEKELEKHIEATVQTGQVEITAYLMECKNQLFKK